jgi:hypothetical protein
MFAVRSTSELEMLLCRRLPNDIVSEITWKISNIIAVVSCLCKDVDADTLRYEYIRYRLNQGTLDSYYFVVIAAICRVLYDNGRDITALYHICASCDISNATILFAFVDHELADNKVRKALSDLTGCVPTSVMPAVYDVARSRKRMCVVM